MDAITRNNIFIENMELINRTMHRHRLLLFALHLDRDDVYQELAIAALRAIESFDPSRSNSIKVHIWAKLQYAILDIKERHKPHGLAAFDRFGTSVWSLELAEEYGFSLVEASFEEQQDSELHLRQALSPAVNSRRHPGNSPPCSNSPAPRTKRKSAVTRFSKR